MTPFMQENMEMKIILAMQMILRSHFNLPETAGLLFLTDHKDDISCPSVSIKMFQCLI